jgi:hypothetical protein
LSSDLQAGMLLNLGSDNLLCFASEPQHAGIAGKFGVCWILEVSTHVMYCMKPCNTYFEVGDMKATLIGVTSNSLLGM